MTPADLKSWRTRMGYTQKQAAEAMGVALRTYQDLEAGRRKIQAYHAKIIEWLTPVP